MEKGVKKEKGSQLSEEKLAEMKSVLKLPNSS